MDVQKITLEELCKLCEDYGIFYVIYGNVIYFVNAEKGMYIQECGVIGEDRYSNIQIVL